MSWVDELKPGTVLIGIQGSSATRYISVKRVTVKKITPTGIIRTDYGSWKVVSIWGEEFTVRPFGGDHHYGLSQLVNPTEKLLEEAEKCEEREEKEAIEKVKIQKAKNICERLSWGKICMTPEIAEAIIKAVED